MTENNQQNPQSSNPLKWWGQQQFELQQAKAWQLGSLLLRLTRGIKEWRLEYHRPQHQHDDEQQWLQLYDIGFAMPEPAKIERYMFHKTKGSFHLMPRLADRSVVIKPVDPIYIPAGQRGTLYISTPLWVAGLVDGVAEPLFDIPVLQPKDTWFGPDPQHGEICYATSVDGRTELNLLNPRAFRAVTPIEFHNTSPHQLRFDRMSVPVPALPLFYSESTGRLWTSQIKVYYQGTDQPARIRIENRTPKQAGEVIYMHPPRAPASALFNMFDSFF